MSSQHRVPVIDKMMQIIEHLEQNPQGDSLSGITKALKTPKSTAYRILNTLLDYRMVELGQGGSYTLGRRLLSLASRVTQSSDIVSLSRPVMEELSNHLGETCKLSSRDGDDVVVLALVQSPRSYGVSTQVGRRLPLHAGAASKLVLAFLPEDEAGNYMSKGLKAYTAHTITAPGKLRRMLAEIRQQGWAEDQEEHTEGVRAIAAPVFDVFDRMVAALSVPFLASASEKRALEVRRAVVAAAQKLSLELGAKVREKAS